jgi:predicted Zn-dependent protease
MKYRTIPLLLEQIKETPDKPNFFTQLAQAYNIVEEYDN